MFKRFNVLTYPSFLTYWLDTIIIIAFTANCFNKNNTFLKSFMLTKYYNYVISIIDDNCYLFNSVLFSLLSNYHENN